MESIKDLYDTYIKNKDTKIIKHKAMTLIVQKFEEVYIDLWCPYDPPSISKKSYVSWLLDKYIQKSLVLLLKSKDEFFDAFKMVSSSGNFV